MASEEQCEAVKRELIVLRRKYEEAKRVGRD
jgi:hypothetical protein